MLIQNIRYIVPMVMVFIFAFAPAADAQDAQSMSELVISVDYDPALSGSVKQELDRDMGQKSGDVQVISNDGTVTLHGYVEDAQDRDEAERVTRDVDGVSRVVNDLWVRDLAQEYYDPNSGD